MKKGGNSRVDGIVKKTKTKMKGGKQGTWHACMLHVQKDSLASQTSEEPHNTSMHKLGSLI